MNLFEGRIGGRTRTRKLDIAIIGTGFAGIGMGIRLKQAGIDSFRIFEAADGVGGTWRDNTYPGAACDVPSHLYSFSFESNPNWTSMFGKQQEILDYLEHCTDKYGLRPHIRFGCGVTGASYDEDDGRWTLLLDGGERVHVDVVVSGTGPLSQTSLPDIPGMERFEGSLFHSARWDHDVDLAGKTVAVIGTGASAIQIVPEVAKQAERVVLYQRTAPWIFPKPDRPIGESERGWYARLPWLQRLYRTFLYWILELRVLGLTVHPRIMKPAERLARRFLAKHVPDPELRAKLTPDYTIGCKRILMSNDYYSTLSQPHVEVVSGGIESLDGTGIVDQDGVHRPADVVVACTGFKAAEDIVPFPIVGTDGATLDEVWSDGPEAYLGTAISGFPNLFLLVGPNTGLGHNSMVFMMESQIRYVMSCLRVMTKRRLKSLEVRASVQRRFNEALQRRLTGTVWASGCASWYQTSSGKITTLWPGFTFEFRARTWRMRAADYLMTPLAEPATAHPSAESMPVISSGSSLA